MSLPFALPENYNIINVAPSQVATAVTYDAVSCKNAHKVWFIVTQLYVADTDITFSLIEATDVAAGTTAAVTAAVPIWYDVDVAAIVAGDPTGALARMTLITSGSSHKFDTTAGKSQMCVIEWDPSKHTAGYDCIQLADTGGHASNYVTAIAIVATRFPQAAPPSALLD
ncbi:hypothetical protein LCGC14_1141550 [marine sediment metagenome]|uniref:Uncharacterized protein n=1 Tax=marine sediment metagenome TaxID=412755 RepID=A0A0F9Q3W0_9ZZZZ